MYLYCDFLRLSTAISDNTTILKLSLCACFSYFCGVIWQPCLHQKLRSASVLALCFKIDRYILYIVFMFFSITYLERAIHKLQLEVTIYLFLMHQTFCYIVLLYRYKNMEYNFEKKQK